MRSRLWLLAMCGIVGLMVRVSTADEELADNDWSLLPKSRFSQAGRYFSRRNNRSSEADKKDDSENEKSGSQTRRRLTAAERRAQALRRSRIVDSGSRRSDVDALRGVKNYHRELFGTDPPIAKVDTTKNTIAEGLKKKEEISQRSRRAPLIYERTSSKDSGGYYRRVSSPLAPNTAEKKDAETDVVRAEFKPRNSAAAGKSIKQVRAIDGGGSPFRTPRELSRQRQAKEVSRKPTPAPTRRIAKKKPAPARKQAAAPIKKRLPVIELKRKLAPVRKPMIAATPTRLRHDVAKNLGAQTATVTIEWIKRGQINVGEEFQCDLVVRNSGSVSASDVVVDAYFPSTVRLTDAQPAPSEQPDHLTWNLKTLAAGEERIIKIQMIPIQRGELDTTAYVRFSGTASSRFKVAEPMLALKVKGPKKVSIGDPASQTVLVSNTGTGLAKNVVVSVVIPKGLEHSRGGKLAIEIGSLNPGETRAVRLPLAAIDGGKHLLQVEVKAAATQTKKLSQMVEVMAPSLKLALDGPKLRYAGRKARYTLTVTNDGTIASNNLRVLHKVPSGFTFESADKGGKFDKASRTASWFVGHLEAGTSTELMIVLMASKLGSYVHHAGAVSEHGARSESELETVIDGTASLVLEVVDLDDPVEIGTATAYEVRVRNDGSKAAKNVVVSCQIPSALQLLSARGPAQHATTRSGLNFKPLGTLAPGKTAIYRVHVKGKVEGNHRFRAQLSSDSIREPLNFDELTRFYGD